MLVEFCPLSETDNDFAREGKSNNPILDFFEGTLP